MNLIASAGKPTRLGARCCGLQGIDFASCEYRLRCDGKGFKSAVGPGVINGQPPQGAAGP